MDIYEIIGWAGASTLIFAYALVSMDKIKPNSLLYQWLNVFGSLALVINTIHLQNIPPAVLNLVWIAIGLFSIARIYFRKSKS